VVKDHMQLMWRYITEKCLDGPITQNKTYTPILPYSQAFL